MIERFHIELSFCKHFWFSSFHPSLIWFAVAVPLFIFLSLPPQFSVIAISWNRSPQPEKVEEDSGKSLEDLPWPGLDENADISVLCAGKGVLWCALIKYTLDSGKSKKGWEFGGEGTREQWGTRGVSLRATWDWGGQFLSHLEGAK